jgi:hypothetical protein
MKHNCPKPETDPNSFVQQLAHSLQLEKLIQTIKSANEDSGNGSQENNNVPMSAYLSIVEENEMLKEALLRLRKRMLSFSSLVGDTASMRSFRETITSLV